MKEKGNKTKKCQKCLEEIKVGSKICSHCGAKQKIGLTKKIIIGIIVLVILGAIFPNDDDSTSSSSSNSNVKEQKIYNIGETISTKKYDITIDNVSTASVVGGEYLKSEPAAGGIYVCVDFSYTNTTDEPLSSFDFPTLRLLDSKGTKYSADINASSYYATEKDPNRKILSDLNPGIKVTDNKVYEISRDKYESDSWQIKIDNDIIVNIK